MASVRRLGRVNIHLGRVNIHTARCLSRCRATSSSGGSGGTAAAVGVASVRRLGAASTPTSSGPSSSARSSGSSGSAEAGAGNETAHVVQRSQATAPLTCTPRTLASVGFQFIIG